MLYKFTEWKQLKNKRCIGRIYGNYSGNWESFTDAKLDCKSDSNCKGLYVDEECRSDDEYHRYHLCNQTAALESDSGSCLYTKLGINIFESCTEGQSQ